jgi:hypothetical protein
MDSDHSPLPSLAAAVATFNQGDFYDCHDQLEALWMEADPVDKPFYQGMLQIAVGFYHLGNENWRGAAILLGEGINRLRSFAPDYQQIAVDQLIDCCRAWLQALQQVGPEMVIPLSQALNQAVCRSQDPKLQPSTQFPSLELIVNDQHLCLPLPLMAPCSDAWQA